MKIAYLILAHNNYQHLQRLIDVLNVESGSRLYIHIDKKSMMPSLILSERAKIVPYRFDINWGGYNMIKATLTLLQEAFNESKSDYYILLSGVDYPIRPFSFLHDKLSTGKQFIDIVPLPQPSKPIERYEYYYYEYNRQNLKHYDLRYLAEVTSKKMKLKRQIPFPLYAGTQWFALTYNCVEYVLNKLKIDNRFENFFKHSLVPDEAFFHTIIGNSHFSSETIPCLTYTDWTVCNPPALIDNKHVEILKNRTSFANEYGLSNPYFARKFNDSSQLVINKIEDELRIVE